MVPLAAFSSFGPGNAPLAVRHQGLFVASTLSFNLAEGVALGDAVEAVDRAMLAIGVPSTIRGSFQGTARVFQQSLSNQPFLILAALIAVGGAAPTYGAHTDTAIGAGATSAEIIDVLVGVVSVVGLPRAVAAASKLSLVLGYDAEEIEPGFTV